MYKLFCLFPAEIRPDVDVGQWYSFKAVVMINGVEPALSNGV